MPLDQKTWNLHMQRTLKWNICFLIFLIILLEYAEHFDSKNKLTTITKYESYFSTCLPFSALKYHEIYQKLLNFICWISFFALYFYITFKGSHLKVVVAYRRIRFHETKLILYFSENCDKFVPSRIKYLFIYFIDIQNYLNFEDYFYFVDWTGFDFILLCYQILMPIPCKFWTKAFLYWSIIIISNCKHWEILRFSP